MKFLGPPPLNILVAANGIVAGLYGLFVVPSDQPFLAAAFMLGGFVLAWRLLSHSVAINDGEIVVNNLLRKHRIPLAKASVAMGGSKKPQDHMWHGQISNTEVISPAVVAADEGKSAGVWIYDLSGAKKPVQVGCLTGRSASRFDEGYAKLARAVKQSAAQTGDPSTVIDLTAQGFDSGGGPVTLANGAA